MAASVHEQVVAAAHAAIAAAWTGAPTSVSRGRVEAHSPDELPAINVRRSAGSHNEFAAQADHAYLEFEVDHIEAGTAWETLVDARHMQIHAALMADATLATLCRGLRCIRTEVRAESGDKTTGQLTATYQAQSLVRISDLNKAVR